jgi:hypothetical protein
MEQNTVIINQLIAQIQDEMKRICYSNTTIWKYYQSAMGKFRKYYALCFFEILISVKVNKFLLYFYIVGLFCNINLAVINIIILKEEFYIVLKAYKFLLKKYF